MAAAKSKRDKPEFKAQVTLEAYKGDKTVNQLASEHTWLAFRSANGSDSYSRGIQKSLAEQGLKSIQMRLQRHYIKRSVGSRWSWTG